MGKVELAKVSGEAAHRYVCKGVAGDIEIGGKVFYQKCWVSDKFAEVSSETPRRNVSEGIVDDAEVGDGGPRRNFEQCVTELPKEKWGARAKDTILGAGALMGCFGVLSHSSLLFLIKNQTY